MALTRLGVKPTLCAAFATEVIRCWNFCLSLVNISRSSFTQEILIGFVNYSYVADDEPTSPDGKMMLVWGSRGKTHNITFLFRNYP